MLAGELMPDQCTTCYEYEDLGIESYRQFESLDWITQLDIESFDDLQKIERPYFYESHIGNHCNIKCRSCQPAFSKPIGDEFKKFNIIAPGAMSWDQYTASIDHIDIDNLDKNSSVYFQGGEPTIMPEVQEFMKRCVGKNKTDFNFKDTAEAFGFGGTWKFFAKHWRFGLDEYRGAFSKAYFLKRLRTLIPSLEMDDIVPGRAGVRAMALSPQGEMIDDFKIEGSGNAIHILNAPSPAATACLAIGNTVADMAVERFNLS